MLTKKEIHLLLDRLQEQTVVEPSASFPFKVVYPDGRGYSKDPAIADLQTKLSIMLEAARA